MFKVNRRRSLYTLVIRYAPLLWLGLAVECAAIVDPTKPENIEAEPKAVAKIYKLESILIGKNRKLAVINGQSVMVGERIALGKIESITAEKVVIRGSKKHILELAGSVVKAPASQSALEDK